MKPCTHESGYFTITAVSGPVRFGDSFAAGLQWCRDCGSVRVNEKWVAPDREQALIDMEPKR